MTIQQMIELIENERDCLQWWSYGDCDMICSECSLKRDSGELYDMYTNAISMMKEKEAIEPIIDSYGNKRCGVCRNKLQSIADKDIFCRKCGRKVKWDDNN